MINEIYFDKFPELETGRLTLRKLALSDAPDMQLIRSDERVMQYMDSVRHTTLQHSEKFINENLEMYSNKKGLFWAIIDKESQEFIGDFAFWQIDHKNSRTEVGYTLKPQCWGKGLMKEAMIEIIRFGFNDLKLHRIEANINPDNNNSRGILLKLGFVKEAYFKESYYYDGQYLDSEIYSLLQSNFKYI